MQITRRIVPASAALVLLLAACGGSDSTETDTTDVVTVPATDAPPGGDFTEVGTSDETVPGSADDGAPSVTDPTTDGGGSDATGTDVTGTDTGGADTGGAGTGGSATGGSATGGSDSGTGGSGGATPATLPDDGDGTGAAPPAGTGGGTGGATPGVASAVDAMLVEWEIDAPTEYAAGEVTFTAQNNGDFPHEFVVIQGESYDTLPLADGGAVLEDELPTGALIGRTDRLGAGSSAELTVDLAPGNYVLVCNLGSGANSHAGQGQNLDITVT